MPYRPADTAFVRSAPLPAWAQPCTLPPAEPPSTTGPALQVRVADTQLWAGETASVLVHRVERIDDASALAQAGHVTLPFNPQFQRLLLHRLRVLRDGASIEHADRVPVQLLQREAGLEQGVVSGVVTATLLVPDLRVGDTLQLVYSVEGDNPIFGGRYAGWAGWDQRHPVALRRVSLTAPRERRIAWQWVGGLGLPGAMPVETEVGAWRRLQWEGQALPAVPFEPYLPRDAHPLRWLQFTEFARWADVTAWAQGLFPLDAPLPAALDDTMAALRALPSVESQVLQALDWVQRQIRYCSIALGEGSHKPRMPADVVARRYGDCKDKSLLLVRMLRALGIEAWPVLAAAQTRSAPLKLLPSPEAFDHVIVQVRLDGALHYLDATRLGQSGDLAHIGQGMEDAAVLVVAPGSDALSPVQACEPAQHFGNELHERYTLERIDGDALLETEQHWHGLGAESLHAMLQRLDAVELGRWALARYERRHPGAQLDAPPLLLHDERLNRLTVQARLRVPRAAHGHAGDWTLRFSAVNLHGAFVLPDILARTMPLAVPSYPGRLHYSVELHWPPGCSPLDEAGSQRLDSPHFELQVERSVEHRTVRHRATLQARTAAVPAAEVARLADDLQRMDGLAHGRFVAQAGEPVPPDAWHAAPPPLGERLRHRLQRQLDASGRAIARGHLHGDELAGAHRLRAQALAELGRGDEALAEAERALDLDDVHPAAWATRGQAHWTLGRFAAAEADYTRALQLDGEPVALWLQRGRARFYAHRIDAALADFECAAAQARDAHERTRAQAWLGWAHRRHGRPLPPQWHRGAPPDAAAWPQPTLALIDGRLSPAQLLDAAARASGDAREQALVEAWFALGQHHLCEGRAAEARFAFERARQPGVTRHAEHAAAGFELQRLGAC
jgi:tetratricopeptide (TPR) repeat protein